jgi:hypothetical protein
MLFVMSNRILIFKVIRFRIVTLRKDLFVTGKVVSEWKSDVYAWKNQLIPLFFGVEIYDFRSLPLYGKGLLTNRRVMGIKRSSTKESLIVELVQQAVLITSYYSLVPIESRKSKLISLN